MKFIIFSSDNNFLPVVQKLKTSFLWADMTPDEVEEDPSKGKFVKEVEKQRLLDGKGFITRHKAQEVVDKLLAMPKTKRQEVTVIFDFNHGQKFGEILKKAGFHGIFAQDWAYDLERKRDEAGKMVKKYYKEIMVPQQVKFGTGSADKILEFLEKQQDKVWVVKPDGEGLWVFPPKSNDPFAAFQETKRFLTDKKNDLNSVPVMLQEKIIGTEINIETAYYRGKPVYAAIDLENKYTDPEERGKQSGCAYDLVTFVPLDCELRRLCNEPFDAIALQMKFTGLMDMNAIISTKDGKPYFIEFCPNRFGYNALFTEIEAYGKGTDTYLKDLTQGTFNPPMGRFACSIKLFDRDHKEHFYDSIFKEDYDYPTVTVEDPEGVWLYHVWKDSKTTRLSHYCDDAVVVTASSDTPQGAIHKAKLKAERAVDFDGKYFRSDVDEFDQPWNPVYRYNFLRDRNLL